MSYVRNVSTVLSLAVVPCAMGQIVNIAQERSAMTSVNVRTIGGGEMSDNDADGTENAGPFVRNLNSTAASTDGGFANATAQHQSSFSATQISGFLLSGVGVQTGSAPSIAEADSGSGFLSIFMLTEASPVRFTATGELELLGRNMDGEPSDLYGYARLRLVNSITEEIIASFNLMDDFSTDSINFEGVLPAGQYALLGSVKAYAFSPDLVGPPSGSGNGKAEIEFSFNVVPTPGAAAAVLMGGVFAIRRRRVTA